MKKKLFLILSVGILLCTGCGTGSGVMQGKGSAGVISGSWEVDVEDIRIPEPEQPMVQPAEQPEPEDDMEPAQSIADVSAPEEPEPEDTERNPEEPKTVNPEPRHGEAVGTSQEEPEVEETQTEAPKPEETEPVQQQQPEASQQYNPASVCGQAIAKCQANGMVTTMDNLANLLAEGKITQEEYNSYYPYDGLGYYSVFVETDLNKASTTSGRKLGSEAGIADYIAGMMLLETDPVFYIEYTGIYSLNGTDFYEFRCYR